MREYVKTLLLAIPTMSAWDRVELLDAIDKMYQLRKKRIIWATVGVVSFMYAIMFIILGLIIKK